MTCSSASTLIARCPGGRRTAAARTPRSPRPRATVPRAGGRVQRRVGLERAPGRRRAAPIGERRIADRGGRRRRGRGASTAGERAARRGRTAGRTVAAHLERGGDVERAVEHARPSPPASAAARDGGAPGRQRWASASRRASRTSTGTSRVASVAVSAERNETRRNSREHLVGIDRRPCTARRTGSSAIARSPRIGAVHGRLERDVGLPEDRQVPEPRDHGQPVAADQRVDDDDRRAGRAASPAAPRGSISRTTPAPTAAPAIATTTARRAGPGRTSSSAASASARQ